MFTWIDGHLLLAAGACFPLAYVLIAASNARLVRRAQQRRDIFTARGAR